MPALAHAADTPTGHAPAKAVASPFKADRLSSQPSGLTPNTVDHAGPLPGPVGRPDLGRRPGRGLLQRRGRDNPGFSKVVWKGDTTQAIAVPEIVLPDGVYWWRVRAVDAAGTQGLWSDVARVAKTWPNAICGTRLSATSPGGPAASFTSLNPYLSWNPRARAPRATTSRSPRATSSTRSSSRRRTTTSPSRRPRRSARSPTTTTAGASGPATPRTTRVRGPSPARSPRPGRRPAPAHPPADGATTHNLLPRPGPRSTAPSATGPDHRRSSSTGSGEPLQGSTRPPSATGLTPDARRGAARQDMQPRDLWWRVRPIIDGVYGTWTDESRVNWQAAAGSAGPTALSSTGDTDTGLRRACPGPRSSGMTPLPGRHRHRPPVQQHPREPDHRRARRGRAASPLPDNQLGTGYWWRVVWGSGITTETPDWVVNELTVPKATYRKQTRVTLSQPRQRRHRLRPAAPLLGRGARASPSTTSS